MPSRSLDRDKRKPIFLSMSCQSISVFSEIDCSVTTLSLTQTDTVTKYYVFQRICIVDYRLIFQTLY